MKTTAAALAATLAIIGCAAPQPELTDQDRAELRPVVCQGEAQCKAMWERAQLWIASNARMKLQLVTDVILQTYNDPEPYSRTLTYTVTREPIGSGAYRITANASCRNTHLCSAPTDLARARLHQFVRETPQ